MRPLQFLSTSHLHFKTLAVLSAVGLLAWAAAAAPIAPGETVEGNINATGVSNLWTFTANSGDAIVVRVGEEINNAFNPKIQLLSPASVSLGTSTSTSAAEVAVTATNSGTFTVVISDNAGTQTNLYRLSLAKTGSPITVDPGDQGGPMTNGAIHTGTILTGELDCWTFTANAGDALIVRLGEITDTNTFTPWLRLYSPSGVLLSSSAAALAAEVSATAPSNGTYLVVVADANGGLFGSGDYRLNLAKTGDPVVVSAGDQGGPMTNDVMHTGTILQGDLDLWTFNANTGEALIVRIGEITDTNTFTPWLRLYSPSGVLLSSSSGAAAAEVSATAPTNGTYLVVVSDGNGGRFGAGDYRLNLAKTGDPVVVSAGDNGGPMTNDVMHTGTILQGDLDMWTISANAGDALIVRIGEITDTNTFTPWLRLYNPSGVLLSSSSGAAAAEVSATASTNGTYVVVVGDGNGGLFGAGDYRLTLAKTGDPVVVSAGDQGGPMTNGFTHEGTILQGDLDVWTLAANAGEAIVVRIGQITDTNTFTPWLRLYSPGGVLLSSSSSAAAAEVSATASSSGTYIVVAGDGNGGLFGAGDYRLTLAKTGSPLVISAGDEGGSLNSGFNPVGTINTGDIDLWTFTRCKGEGINLRLDELVDSSGNFTPWIRLYGPSGTLLGTVSGATTAQINLAAPTNGTYVVLISDGNGALSGTGTYQLTSNGLTFEPRLCTPVISGSNLILTGVGGVSNAVYVLYQTTTLSIPLASWTPVTTNLFDSFGVLNRTNFYDSNVPEQFFRYKMP